MPRVEVTIKTRIAIAAAGIALDQEFGRRSNRSIIKMALG